MDDTTYKPIDINTQLFSDIEKVIEQLLTDNNVSDVEQLPLSCFSNYTPKKENLNIYNQKKLIEKYISNSMTWLSAGNTNTQYISGIAFNKQNKQQDLLNVNSPTCNFIPEKKRLTYDQIGGFFLPHKITPLTYVSFNPQPVVLHDNIKPSEQYILPDVSIYGAGFGNNPYGVEQPINHVENNSYIKAPWVNIGQNGKLLDTHKMPAFQNYTSTDIVLGAPKFGISKYTDNYDFWAGSRYGDVWANEDVYELKEANKYYITERSYELLTDICESPYRWRTDIYGNEYMLFKPATFVSSKIHAGSDTDGDGIDDKIGSQDPESRPAFDPDDGSPDGVDPSDLGGGRPGGDGTTGDGSGGGGSGSTKIDDETGEEIIDDDVIEEKEAAGIPDQFSVRECKYWLYGGDSFDPGDAASLLDSTSHTYEEETITGTISSIIDGGWRPLRTGTQTGYTPAAGDWPIAGNVTEDQTENSRDILTSPGGEATGGYPSFPNGFIDVGMLEFQTNGREVGSEEYAEFIPDYTIEEGESYKMTIALNINPTVKSQYTRVFNYRYKGPETGRYRPIGDPVYKLYTGRDADDDVFKYKLADGGWEDPLNDDPNWSTFERVNCDRASYIVGLYGQSGRPDFGNHVFACRLWDLTEDPSTYLSTDSMRKYAARFMVTNQSLSEEEKLLEADEIINEQILNARIRGPMHAMYFRSPISFIAEENAAEGKPPIQFFGHRTSLIDWLVAAGNDTYTPAMGEADKQRKTRLYKYNYLEELEYLYMRVSPIEGTGVGQIDFETASLYATDEEGYRIDTAQFINLTGRDILGATYNQFYSRGDADVFYYHGHPNDFQQQAGRFAKADGSGFTFYTTVSSECTYIDNYVLQEADGTYRAQLRDLDGRGTQFPQVYHINGVRQKLLSVEEYNDEMTCNNIAEFRYAPQDLIDNKFYQPNVDFPQMKIKIAADHPFEASHNLEFEIKRGYWPPPVAQLRRSQGYGGPTITGNYDWTNPGASTREITFNDAPIENNLLPATNDDGSLGQFYLHDVWDGSGFGGYFEALLDSTYTEPIGGTEDEPMLNDGSGTIGEDPSVACAAGRTEEQLLAVGIKWFTHTTLPDGSGVCIPTCDLENGWRQALTDDEDPTACHYDPEGAKQILEEIGAGGEGIGNCSTCITISGTFIRNSCGGYDGFSQNVEHTSANESPCYPGKYVPMVPISNLRKYSSDLGDWCIPSRLPTIWEQQNNSLHELFGEGDNITQPKTAFFRNKNNRVYDFSDILETLVFKYQGINVDHNNVLTDQCKLVDFDIIYDTIVLKYNNLDTRTGGYDSHSYIFDSINNDESTGKVNFSGSDTKFIKTDVHDTSQLLSHFLNEDDNVVIAGRTYTPDGETSDDTIVPELYELNLKTNKFTRVYPSFDPEISSAQIEHHKLPEDISADYKFSSIDPGHISYNPDTGNYSVIHTAYITHKSDTSFEPAPVIITSIFNKHNRYDFRHVDTIIYAPDTIETNTVTEIDNVESQTIFVNQDEQDTETITINAFESDVELNLKGLDVNILKLYIDFGDGEQVDVYSDFHTLLPRYTGTITYLHNYTYLKPDASGAGPKAVFDSALIRHNIVHRYQSTGGGETYTMKLSGVYSNSSSTFTKTYNVQANRYSTNQISSNKGVKIINTKLFSHDGEEKALLSLEMQGDKRYIGHNILTIINK